jgi:hypothetical protein
MFLNVAIEKVIQFSQEDNLKVRGSEKMLPALIASFGLAAPPSNLTVTR